MMMGKIGETQLTQPIPGESWRSPNFRQKVMAQIEDAVRQAGNPTTKTSLEMENHVYQKAKCREEYLALVARLIIHVREINSKKEKAGNAAAQAAMGPQSMQDPINALQNLAKQNLSPGIPPQGPGMPGQMPPGQQLRSQMHPAMQQQMMQRPGQPQVPPQMQAQRPDAFMMQQAGMVNPQQQIPVMGIQQMTMPMTIQYPRGPPGPLQRQNSGPYPGPVYNQYGLHDVHYIGPAMTSPNTTPTTPTKEFPPPYLTRDQQQQHPPGQQVPVNILNTQQPSPIPQGPHMIHSPATALACPSPQSQIVPSPASRAMGAPSPVQLHTPGNVATQGAVPSPASRSAEDQAYLDKLQQLSKYIEPLKKYIQNFDKGDEHKKEKTKMTNLLEILSDSSKRLPMAALLKCEQVLEKMDLQVKVQPAAPTVTSQKPPEQHICLPLLDTIASHMKSPLLNHTLQRTFGPALYAIQGGPPVRSSSPPAKRKRIEQEKDNEVTDLLQGELARLEQRFKCTLDPVHHSGSKTVHLVFKLDDRNLPSVPPIMVTVPEDYPRSSPKCDTGDENYDSTPFLQALLRALRSKLDRMPDTYSVTALLNTWEMSVRQACASASA